MSQSIITLAFEQYKAEQEATATAVELNEFVLANIPNQDPSLPIDRGEGLPAAEFIVHVADTSQEGFVNPNAVVYSLIMDTTIGDFEFNWIGLRNKESGVIAAISHVPTVSKFKTIAGVQNGNAVTRSIMMSYFGAQALTNINVDASTWQIDFTARLSGMDERVRLANVDHYGHATFLNDGFEVQKTGSDYSAKMGTGYLGGLRCHSLNAITIADVVPNSGIYLDASYQGQLTSQWQSVFSITCSETELTDYIDEHNVQHYVTKIAEIDGDGNVVDTRFIGGTAEFERADNAATDADIDSESKEKKHVKLPQFWRGIQKFFSNKNDGISEKLVVTEKALSSGLDKKLNKTELLTFQFQPYDLERIYMVGEICFTKNIETGELSYWQWYSNVESLAGKDPLDLNNRFVNWSDITKPPYWVPYLAREIGSTVWFGGSVIPETMLVENNQDVPKAVYWRLALARPELVVEDIIQLREVQGRYLRAADGSTYRSGETHEDAIRNMTGTMMVPVNAQGQGDGVFTTPLGTPLSLASGSSSWRHSSIQFDASTQVPTANQNQPVTMIEWKGVAI
ncbi:phage tail protein [Aliivibrio sp. S4TY2]|uniref:phage tail-collar fiber domain-containing protein n=1 Tax=unclassified Aliivibrio TaxID=2645654 RepID=UPI00237A067F|nr:MULTISPECIES: phage tail protein [unclassified Aliivibrio]MDD9155465.1 phage tail protein [Aliivibrio sp. S4TY2]MDD9161592.1 phage tail protein [Aliivibrio sp. S4TY1]MDD9165622.1 phage tail protein [Aliivibrio sp. S4MY2]MDD9169621.1 phage tail protein [Aliivibrio sp. S4MY4]MDD9186614.1 phage tail protein [Aliivibrio sp. S4MY3]